LKQCNRSFCRKVNATENKSY